MIRSMTRCTGCLCLLALGLALPGVADARGRRVSTTGDLVIESSTTGAQVLVDDVEVGTIPLGGPLKLRPGQHTVKVVKPGYTQYLETVAIKAGKSVRLEVDLFPVVGVLHLKASEAGARVYVDGKFIGQTPLSGVELKAGTYKLRISKIGFYDVLKTVTVTAGQEQRLEATMLMLPADINPLLAKKPRHWYEKWWVWASAAGGLVALATAIAVPLAVQGKDPIKDFRPDRIFIIP
jgi:hypothetical protein